MQTKNLAELYNLPPLEWDSIVTRLEAGVTQAPGTGGPDHHTCWLATINADGSPHVTGIGAIWADGAMWFVTGEHSVKGRNVARDPRCAVTMSTNEFDLVIEGDAAKVTDRAVLEARAEHYRDEGWPAQVDDTGTALTAEYSAPSAGPPPWHLYRITPRRATALGIIEPGGATTWQF